MSDPIVLHIKKLTWRQRFLGIEGLRPPWWRVVARARWKAESRRKFLEEWARVPQQIEGMKRFLQGSILLGYLEHATVAYEPTIWINRSPNYYVTPVEGDYISIDPHRVQDELCKVVSVMETPDRVGIGVHRGISPSRACPHLAGTYVVLLAQKPEET